MRNLYSREEQERAAACWRRSRRLAWGVIGGTLGVCALLCAFVRTGTARPLMLIVMGLSTLGGWAAILLFSLTVQDAKAAATHMAGILEGTEETHAGRLKRLPETVRIPHSVCVCRVTLDEGAEKPLRLRILADRADALPEDGSQVRLTTVRSFITGIEVCHGGG